MKDAARGGRIEVAWLLAGLCAAALLAVVYLGWWPARVRLALLEAQGRPAGPAATDASSLASAIEKLDQRLARIESSLAVQASRGSREELKPTAITDGNPPDLAASPKGPDDVHDDLLQLAQRIDALADSLKKIRKQGFELPTLAQIRSARRQVNWTFVEDIRKLCRANESAALERVRFMSFDDLLREVGPPTTISGEDGRWEYSRPATDAHGQETTRGMGLLFTSDYVTGVFYLGDD